MRKLIIFICVLLAGGALYALVPALFPDTPLFPRTPTADGTVGGVLEKIVGGIISDATDGTVANTAKLAGTTATGYLKNTACGITERWVRIDADGKAVCDSVNPILADYGTVSEQGCDADIYHASGSTSKTSTGKILKAGDIVKTQNNPNCTLTIAFADFSILRLDADTTVSLDVLAAPAPSTQTIASAILSNGSLWGRILTDTGSYSIGTDKIVAGVRGTSVAVVQTGVTITMGSYSSTTGKWSMTKVGTPSTPFLAIPHSQSPDNTISGDIGNTTIKIGNSVTGPNMVNFTRNPVENLYQDSPWIRRNTATDLGYMYRLLAFSVEPLPKVTTEISISQPTSPLNPEAQNLCENGQIWWTSRYGCQPRTLYAIVDYTLPIPSGVTQASTPFVGTPTTLIYSGSSSLIGLPEMPGSVHPPAGINGVEITQTGQYIQYYPDPNFTGGLMGRIMTVELQSPVGSSLPNPLGNKWYVADLGTSKFFVWKNTNCAGTSTTGINWLCPSNIDVTNSLTITIPLSTSSIAAIGNIWIPTNTSLHLKTPIGTNIKKLTISP